MRNSFRWASEEWSKVIHLFICKSLNSYFLHVKEFCSSKCLRIWGDDPKMSQEQLATNLHRLLESILDKLFRAFRWKSMTSLNQDSRYRQLWKQCTCMFTKTSNRFKILGLKGKLTCSWTHCGSDGNHCYFDFSWRCCYTFLADAQWKGKHWPSTQTTHLTSATNWN